MAHTTELCRSAHVEQTGTWTRVCSQSQTKRANPGGVGRRPQSQRRKAIQRASAAQRFSSDPSSAMPMGRVAHARRPELQMRVQYRVLRPAPDRGPRARCRVSARGRVSNIINPLLARHRNSRTRFPGHSRRGPSLRHTSKSACRGPCQRAEWVPF